MSYLNEIQIFVAIVERGSFIAASNHLRIPKTTVSRKIEELEARLGVRLLQRTTRKMSLTEAGQAYFEHCERILSEIDEAERAVGQLAQAPRGTLRVSASFSIGSRFLGRLLPEFLRRYPDVRVNLQLSNSQEDLVEGNFDLAVRAGRLADSSHASRTLANLRSHMVASIGYVKEKGLPVTPEQLAEHRTLALSPRDERGGRYGWALEEVCGGRKKAQGIDAPINPVMICNDPDPIVQGVLGGEGIGFVPDLFIADYLRQGLLVQVMPEWLSLAAPISAVYPSRRGLSPKVRVFVDYLAGELSALADLQPQLEGLREAAGCAEVVDEAEHAPAQTPTPAVVAGADGTLVRSAL
ncbi:MAG TPA: LysR substrate-binding domain-containing protein [Burkholderiales bacterium]|jgi:DNA-binding transcriptional LysR family regulator